MKNQNKHLKYISHGIYLQIFIGFGLIVPAFLDLKLPEFITSPKTLAAMFIGLGIIFLIYINRYKKSLKEES